MLPRFALNTSASATSFKLLDKIEVVMGTTHEQIRGSAVSASARESEIGPANFAPFIGLLLLERVVDPCSLKVRRVRLKSCSYVLIE
jgi:hypothetical protein